MGKRKRRGDLELQLPDDILLNIFKRIPAKPLMRLKCVCKSWKTLISSPYLANLHYKVSQTRPDASYLIFYLRKNFSTIRSIFPTNLEAALTAGLPTHNFQQSSPCTDIVNGLICFFDRKDYQLKMLNITTGEKVTLPYQRPLQFRYPSMFLGFDPHRKEYKVLCTLDFGRQVKWRILTIGTNLWRTMGNKPLLEKFKKGTICVDGCIYWKDELFVDGERAIQYFHVGEEKFGMVFPPKRTKRIRQVTRIGDDLAIVYRKPFCHNLLKLWIFNKEDKNWAKNVIKLPRIPVSRLEVIGTTHKTSEILMTTKLGYHDMLQLVFYNLETENLRTSNISCPGMPSIAAGNLLSYDASATVSNHVENIFPLEFSSQGTA
nr:putative F-box protein At5g52610 [Coffea arabica]